MRSSFDYVLLSFSLALTALVFFSLGGCATQAASALTAPASQETITPRSNNFYQVELSRSLLLSEGEATERMMRLVSPLCDAGMAASMESRTSSPKAFSAMIRCIPQAKRVVREAQDRRSGAMESKQKVGPRNDLENDIEKYGDKDLGNEPDDDILDPEEDMASGHRLPRLASLA